MREQFISKRFNTKSKQRLIKIDEIMDQYRRQGYDLSLRQLYYQLVARDLIENSDKSYKRIGNLLNDARLAGVIDWDMISDRHRSTNSNFNFGAPVDGLDWIAYHFDYDTWLDQPVYIELMVEKDALSGVLWPVCAELDIRFTANKGYPSASLLYRMSKRLKTQSRLGKEVIVIHLGDHDPSGIDMTRDLQDRFDILTGISFEVDRLALNMDQIDQYNPPENPAKVTDSRYGGYLIQFGDSSWELDALEPQVMAQLITDYVINKRDPAIHAEALSKEKSMKKELQDLADSYENSD